MEPVKNRKIFSKAEAEALLPELESRLKDLHQKKDAYNRVHDSLFMHELLCDAERSQGFSEGTEDLETSMFALEEAIEALAKDVEAIFALGCFLRHIEKGIIEFHGVHEGRDVFFLWRRGEPIITRYRLPREKTEKKL